MTQNIFFISDTHWHHANIIKYSNRPFSSVEEMDEKMVQNWNSVVKPADKVYHLGDVYFNGKKNNSEWMFNRLNGTKVLILGNHDVGKDQILHNVFKRIYSYRILPELGVFLSHVPIQRDSINRRCTLNLHGHTHEKGSPDGPYRSACVELWNYTPVSYEEIIRS